jgi:hypothetical protein
MSAPELKISTANDVPAILHDGPDGVPQSGHSVSKERLSLSTREMNDQKDTINNNDNEEACDTSPGAGTGNDRDREACDTSTGTDTSVSKERLSLSARDMNDQKDKVNDNDNDEACDTSTGAGTGDDRDREACNAGTGAEAGDDREPLSPSAKRHVLVV